MNHNFIRRTIVVVQSACCFSRGVIHPVLSQTRGKRSVCTIHREGSAN
jgi:hypothetical protein